jgi:hypothetical protein
VVSGSPFFREPLDRVRCSNRCDLAMHPAFDGLSQLDQPRGLHLATPRKNFVSHWIYIANGAPKKSIHLV